MENFSASQVLHFSRDGRIRKHETVQEGLTSLKEDGFVWFDFFNPARDVLDMIADKLRLHQLSVEDCFDDTQIPKIEDYTENTFLIFNSFNYSGQILEIQEIDFFLGKNYLISVSGYNSELPVPLRDIARVIEQNKEAVKHGPAYLMYLILDGIVDHKFSTLEKLEDELVVMEEEILAEAVHFEPSGIMRLRRYLLVVRKSLFHEREILQKICRKDFVLIPEKTIFHYRDIYDHLVKYFELTETYREIVTSQMELFMSIQNNRMARNSNETNMVVKRLTLITTIFMPLTLLAGIGGMSEWTMMTGAGNWKISYPLLFLGMILIAAINYWFLKKFERGKS
jgi:magnesium transporter